VTTRDVHDETFRPSEDLVAAVRETLLAWFEDWGRDLPWRRTRDPWRILVSEVMLQQIQVGRAIPFYEPFLARFPTLASLAAAPLSDAIVVWGDLGRYRRVVALHRTARLIVERYDGRIPPEPEALAELPGIGPYTAGAVACFAFERDVAFADTNARRVLHRVFMGPDVPEPAAPEHELMDLARRLVPPGRSWAWNQALIELGALVCTARAPRCASCPVRDHCGSRPAILGLLAAEPARRGPATVYEGSNRFYRGRVLAALRDAPRRGLSLHKLGTVVFAGTEGGSGRDAGVSRLREIVESLSKDGLVILHADAQAVAEEGTSYAGDETTDAGPGLQVRLP
jgi:A/G-specific adenine glycosylase